MSLLFIITHTFLVCQGPVNVGVKRISCGYLTEPVVLTTQPLEYGYLFATILTKRIGFSLSIYVVVIPK